jgi:hypothetical protein
MQQPAVRYAARLAAYSTAATHLSLLSDRRLAELVATAAPHGSGIGGSRRSWTSVGRGPSSSGFR